MRASQSGLVAPQASLRRRPVHKEEIMNTLRFKNTCLAAAGALMLSACGAAPDEQTEQTDPGAATVEQGLKNGDLVDVSGAIVELLTSKGGCTATMINENSLVTAAHCGAQNNSYW